MMSCARRLRCAELTEGPSIELRIERGYATWRSLYLIAGVAALVVVASLPVAVYVFVAWPPPTSVTDWFNFLQSNKLAAVVDLDLVMLIDQVLFVPIILALYVVLRRANEPLVLLGTAGSLIGGVLVIVAREATLALPMLSDQYAAATTDVQRSVLLAAGQTLLTTFNGTAFSIGYTLIGLSGLVLTGVMLRSSAFSKATAYSGVAMYALGVVPPTIGTLGVVLSLMSLAPLVPFQILLARRFFQLATRDPGNASSNG
jgi:hypothetical protein